MVADGEPGRARGPLRRNTPRARRFLARRKHVLARLAAWSLLESASAFLGGYSAAKALDDGFLAGRTGAGLGWLALGAVVIVAGGAATRGVFGGLADLVEPLRDGLVRGVVSGALQTAVAGPARSGDSASVSRLTHQTETVRDSFAGLVLVARSFVFTAAGALLGLATLASGLLLVVVPPLLLGLALFTATLVPMAARQRDFLRADEALAERFGTVAGGLRDVVACGAGERTASEAGALIAAQTQAARSLARWAAARSLALGIAGQLPVVLLLIATPWLLREGLTAGALLGALTYLTQALLPALHSLMQALGAAGTRLLVVLDHLTSGFGEREGERLRERGLADADADGDGDGDAGARAGAGADVATLGRPVPVGRPRAGLRPEASDTHAELTDRAPEPTGVRVELTGVTFAYGPGARPVLEDLDLVAAPGEHLVVVGPSGIGKSTLTALVAGLLTPDRGEIRVNGERVDGAGDPALRRVLIPQQAYVFTGTLRDNLLYLCPGPPPPAVVEASVEAVGLGPLAARLGGLGAEVDPGALSQGERQLVALARAHLSPAPLVMLDEATCHLDPEAEARAELAFAARPGTLLVVAHRISSARRADRVLVLDGTRAALGTHDQLLESSPLYGDLVGRWEARVP
ncbi:ATP-binding cassette domain-containing protein [Streptomyces sp. NPDC048639]|uniref:ATP-binding cassette domain-containing protein n=1 Tax=Streptomyces sp. NPDC048639 TaxID=3365581 RepID=UPI0037156FB1